MGSFTSPQSSLTPRNRAVLYLAAISFLICAFLYLSLPRDSLDSSTSSVSTWLSNTFQPKLPWSTPTLDMVESKYAYVTLLANDKTRNEEGDIYNDKHFVGIRILAYQILHAEETRSDGIPLLVLAVRNTNEAKKERLRKDGAIVIDIEPVAVPTWVQNHTPAWSNMFDKLRIWELTQFERVVYLDADVVLAKPLDGIFESVALQTKTAAPLTDEEQLIAAPLPPFYVFASEMEMQVDHHYPPTAAQGDFDDVPDYFNAGFFLTKPSHNILDYYISLLHTPHAFKAEFMEQDMLNFAHRVDGRMPWVQLDTKWNIHYPTLGDLQGGVHSLHVKWWYPHHDELRGWLADLRQRMEDFFTAWDARHVE